MRPSARAIIALLSSLLFIPTCGKGTASAQDRPCTGIMGAFSEEVSLLEEALKEPQIQSVLGVRFVTGTLEGRSVVLACSGVGKVNAAMTATLMIDHFRPKEILFTGIAGAIGPDLRPGDIVLAEKTAQHDLGTLTPDGLQLRGMRNPIDWVRNPVFFEGDGRLLALAEESGRRVKLEKVQGGADEGSPRVLRGIIVSGDVFVASPAKKEELRKSLKADAVEMEGAAVAQICYQCKLPCLVIRSISDSADASARQDASAFLSVAVRNSARLVTDIVGRLPSK